VLKWRILMVVVAAVAIVGAGCSDNPETSTTDGVTTGDDVVFGDGVMPDTIPADFPLPTGSAVGSTMVVSKSGFTEVVVRVSAGMGISAEFFNQGLAQAGYSVDRSEADGAGWVIEFSKDSTRGSLDITEPVEGISQAILRWNLP
jgi:hypothetical protein